MTPEKSNIELKKTLLCTRCGVKVLKGDPLAGTQLVTCPACHAAKLGINPIPSVNERVDVSEGEYALNLDINILGLPSIHLSIGEEKLKKYAEAIDRHRKTGKATLDKSNGDEE